MCSLQAPPLDLLPSQQTFLERCEASVHEHPEQAICVITGSPGVGKSTVLEALAAQHDGALLVDLRGVHDEADLLNALARALDLHQEPAPDVDKSNEARHTQLLEALCTPEAPWLILDHGEYLHAPLSAILQDIASTPHRPLILASRRALPVGHRHELTPPSTLDARELMLRHTPSSRRAALSEDPDALDALNAALEYNPLAIKVCAPRLGLFKPRDIMARLSGAQGTHTHDTLQEAFAWSWELLDEHAQHHLTMCACFSGWFDHDLATHIFDEPADDILDELYDHSLLERLDIPEHAPRYRLTKPLVLFLKNTPSLTTTIEKAEERLAHFITARCHTLHDVTLNNHWNITPKLLPELVAQHILPTLRWWQNALETNPKDIAILEGYLRTTLGANLLLWQQQDFAQLHTMHAHLKALIAQDDVLDTLDADLRLRVICTHSDYYTLLFAPPSALEVLQRIDPLAHGLTPRHELLWSLQVAQLSPFLERDEAERIVALSLELATQLDEPAAITETLLGRAHLHIHQRQLPEALECLEQARAYGERLPNPRSLARVLIYLGHTYHEFGQPQKGTAAMEEALRAFTQAGDMIGAAHALRELAWQSVDHQNYTRSKRLLDDLLALATRHGLGWMHGFGHFLLGQHELDQQRYPQALIAYERARYHLERHQLIPLLAASQLYRSICYKLTGDIEMARRIYDEGATHLDAVKSAVGKVHYLCERAEWHAHDGSRKLAQDALKQARTFIVTDNTDDLLSLIIEVYQCKIDLTHYFNLRDQHKSTERLYRTILERLSRLQQPLPHSSQLPLDACIEVRLAWAQLQRELPEEFLRRFLVELQDPGADALILDPSQRAYRPPTHYDWIELGRKQNPYNLLLLLAERHLTSPGQPVSDAEILAHLWPDEQIAPDAARNRLYVTLSSLRNSGDLKPYILNIEGGYLLKHDLTVLEV